MRWFNYHFLATQHRMRLEQLEDENSRMRGVITDLTVENEAMKELAAKNPRPLAMQRSREGRLRTAEFSHRAACRLTDFPRRSVQYQTRRVPDDPALIQVMDTMRRYGYRIDEACSCAASRRLLSGIIDTYFTTYQCPWRQTMTTRNGIGKTNALLNDEPRRPWIIKSPKLSTAGFGGWGPRLQS